MNESLKYSAGATKIGFADVLNGNNFIGEPLTKQEQVDLLYSEANIGREKSGYKPLFSDEKECLPVSEHVVEKVATRELKKSDKLLNREAALSKKMFPSSEDLTAIPQKASSYLDSDVLIKGVLLGTVFILISKLFS